MGEGEEGRAQGHAHTAAVAQSVEQAGRNGQVVGSSPTGGSEEGRAQGHAPTVVLRLVGVATLVGHKVQGLSLIHISEPTRPY